MVIFIYYVLRPAAACPSFLTFSFLPFFLSPASSRCLLSPGDLTQWHLPVGMKDLDLTATKVTGKAPSDEVHIYLMRFEASRSTSFIPHFFLLPTSSLCIGEIPISLIRAVQSAENGGNGLKIDTTGAALRLPTDWSEYDLTVADFSQWEGHSSFTGRNP